MVTEIELQNNKILHVSFEWWKMKNNIRKRIFFNSIYLYFFVP